jgi:hypothetical protein
MPRRQATFGDDLAASLASWSKAPALPGITLLLGVLMDAPDYLGPAGLLLGFAASLLLAGWFGTQRVWYLRLFRGKQLSRHELWPMTRAFIGRYLALGLIVAVPMAAIVIPVFAAVDDPSTRAIALLPVVFVVDVVLTFVTPALAFSTWQASAALATGWQTLREGWPAAAPYALLAPLVVIGLAQVLSRALGAGGSIGLTAVGYLLGLWFKGATAAYYLRQHDVGDDGAAFDGPGRHRSGKR